MEQHKEVKTFKPDDEIRTQSKIDGHIFGDKIIIRNIDEECDNIDDSIIELIEK